MNRKFALITLLTLGSFIAHAGVKVTSLNLKTEGSNGYINVALKGRSHELPDVRVHGKTIEISLSDAEAFQAIRKTVQGADLSANVLNGKAIIKASLPYDIPADGVNVGWRNNNMEVIFPRGKVTHHETVTKSKPQTEAPAAPARKEVKAPVTAKTESKVSKDVLNEDYLNKLMKENGARNEAEVAKANVATGDEVKVKQSSIALPKDAKATFSKTTDKFSFAGYTAKFAVFLALVLGLFYGVVQLLKKGVFNRGKLGFLNNSQMIQVLSTTYVAPKRSLMVVKAHKQIFLVANSESGIEFLSEMTDTAGLIKEGEKQVTGTNFDTNLGTAEAMPEAPAFKLKENINESTPVPEEKGIAALSAKEIVKFSDELKKKAKKLKPIEFN